jgi:hypothetical protein
MIYTLKIRDKIPLITKWIIRLWFIYFLIFTFFRIATLLLFRPANIPFSSLIPSFLLGFRYDAKWIAIILLPVAVLTVYKKYSPFYSEKNIRSWSYYLAIVTLLVLFFFGADIGNFSYNHSRINASALNFADDLMISFKMLWQSYPMLWISAGFVLCAGLTARLFKKIHITILKKNSREDHISSKRWHAGTIVFMAWCLYGVFSFTPLKWRMCGKP